MTQSSALAQSMELSGGTLTVAEGTRIAVVGPIQWTLAPGSQVVNNGRIELGSQATLQESDASPVIGSGTEHASIIQSGALTDFEAGGLGLAISTAGLGTTEVVRGHQVLLNNDVDQSIARWYRLEPTPSSGTELDLQLRYASSELNSLNGNTLALYLGDTQSGPWSFVPSVANGNARTVQATWDGPWAPVITAFTQGISTGIQEPVTAVEFAVWPSPTTDLLWVRDSNDGVQQLQLVDASGRTVRELRNGNALETATLSLQDLPSGLYLLRVNGQHTVRVVKE